MYIINCVKLLKIFAKILVLLLLNSSSLQNFFLKYVSSSNAQPKIFFRNTHMHSNPYVGYLIFDEAVLFM